jgi:hypothetical protein
MHRNHLLAACTVAYLWTASSASAADAAGKAYRLAPRLASGDAARVAVSLEVGGELIVPADDGQDVRLPMSVVAKLAYTEQLIAWWSDPAMASRSLRRYSEAHATIKSAEKGDSRDLPPADRMIVAKAGPDATSLNGLERRLTRPEYDLVDVVGNSLIVDRLLPGRELKPSDGWDHDAATIGALLGMDHVAICEVRSVVLGEESRQVKIRMAGTIHGTVEGAATEMDVRGAYLFHLDEGRITKFNLAIKEVRKPGEVSPGLDVVAKLSLVATPISKKEPQPFDEAALAKAREMSAAELGELQVESPERGYRFRHDASWYVTAEQREHMSLRLLQRGDFLAHCNVTTLPMRPADKPTTLQAFEADISSTLGDKLEKVEAATEWANAAGHRCLGVIAVGAVDGVPVQWRYYHVSDDAVRPVAVSVTVEQSLLERFGDADKSIVDSMTLIDAPAAATAVKPLPVTK